MRLLTRTGCEAFRNSKRKQRKKLADYRNNLEESNRERAETVRAELKDMGDTLRSDLKDFSTRLAGFKTDLDEAEKNRKNEAREEIADRGRYISGLRNDTPKPDQRVRNRQAGNVGESEIQIAKLHVGTGEF